LVAAGRCPSGVGIGAPSAHDDLSPLDNAHQTAERNLTQPGRCDGPTAGLSDQPEIHAHRAVGGVLDDRAGEVRQPWLVDIEPRIPQHSHVLANWDDLLLAVSVEVIKRVVRGEPES
jgi:hypothetical protein